MFDEEVNSPQKRFKAMIGRLLWLEPKNKYWVELVRHLRGVYTIFFSIRVATKVFKPLILFGIFRFYDIKDTGIPIHIWGGDNMV